MNLDFFLFLLENQELPQFNSVGYVKIAEYH